VVRFSGQYQNTLDDKGRLSIPAGLRETLQEHTLILTKGIEHCVWVLPPEYWEKMSAVFMNPKSLDMTEASSLHYRFIVPKQEVEIDKAGRIAVPSSLRDFACLSRECAILGKGNFIEIWDAEAYKAFEVASEVSLKAALAKLGPIGL
jgi:MraZ protein